MSLDDTFFEKQEQLHRESTFSYRLQDLIGRCMSLGVDLNKGGHLIEESLIEAARECVVKVAARLEIPLEVNDG